MMRLSAVLLAIFSFVLCTSAYKILIYSPRFGGSHTAFCGKLADTLAEAGHEIVIYQPILNLDVKFTGSKNKAVRVITRPYDPSLPVLDIDGRQAELWKGTGVSIDMLVQMNYYKTSFCKQLMEDNNTIEALRSENFDLGISEPFELCGYGLLQAVGINKYISAMSGSIGNSHLIPLGVPAAASFVPGMRTGVLGGMNFLERAINFLALGMEKYILSNYLFANYTEVIEPRVPGFSIQKAVAKAAIIFVNTDEVIAIPQAVPSNVIYIGGFGSTQAKPLERNYVEIFDKAKQGVVLFSFGTVVKSSMMPPEYKQMFLQAFSQFPDITFLWKYELDDGIADGHSNVITSKWLPQNDILEHPKLLTFITHGGMNSAIESSTKGVPVVCLPVFADQDANCKLLKHRGMAQILDKNNLSTASIVNALREIITNPSYRKSAKLLSAMVKAKPMTPDEKIIKYTEFAAQFGDTGVFQLEGQNLNFIQLHNYDVIAALLLAVVAAIALVFTVLRFVIRFVRRQTTKSKSE